MNDEKVQYAEVFISSTRKDSDIYSKIRYALSRKGISVFDDWQLTAGSDWTEAIANAIQNAKKLEKYLEKYNVYCVDSWFCNDVSKIKLKLN